MVGPISRIDRLSKLNKRLPGNQKILTYFFNTIVIMTVTLLIQAKRLLSFEL